MLFLNIFILILLDNFFQWSNSIYFNLLKCTNIILIKLEFIKSFLNNYNNKRFLLYFYMLLKFLKMFLLYHCIEIVLFNCDCQCYYSFVKNYKIFRKIIK